jgi:hypothetical protein
MEMIAGILVSVSACRVANCFLARNSSAAGRERMRHARAPNRSIAIWFTRTSTTGKLAPDTLRRGSAKGRAGRQPDVFNIVFAAILGSRAWVALQWGQNLGGDDIRDRIGAEYRVSSPYGT